MIPTRGAPRPASRVRPPRRSGLIAIVAIVVCASAAEADLLPSRPITFFDDRVIVSGEVTLTVGTRDDGYFNALDYSHDAFNLLTLAGSIEVRAHDRVSVLAEIVDEVGLRSRPFGPSDRNVLRLYALYVRVQPLDGRSLFVQAGRVPPVFGAFGRQDYGAGNPLIGVPLAYQYPSVVRADVVPPSYAELVANRGEGWFVRYPRASLDGAQGVPLLTARRWDTGVQASWGADAIDVSVGVTNGSLSKPLTVDDNGGKQLSARVGLRPSAAVSLGTSVAFGEFVSDDAREVLQSPFATRRYRQDAFGVDGEVSRGHVLVRGEVVTSRWFTPFVSGEPEASLRAWSAYVEGRVTLSPRWAVAARGEWLQFSELLRVSPVDSGAGGGTGPDPYDDPYPPGPSGTPATLSWDAPVTRGEIGVSYRLKRNVRLKAAWQYDWRDGGRVRREGQAGVQIAYWF